jgi:hypothetical protein
METVFHREIPAVRGVGELRPPVQLQIRKAWVGGVPPNVSTLEWYPVVEERLGYMVAMDKLPETLFPEDPAATWDGDVAGRRHDFSTRQLGPGKKIVVTFTKTTRDIARPAGAGPPQERGAFSEHVYRVELDYPYTMQQAYEAFGARGAVIPILFVNARTEEYQITEPAYRCIDVTVEGSRVEVPRTDMRLYHGEQFEFFEGEKSGQASLNMLKAGIIRPEKRFRTGRDYKMRIGSKIVSLSAVGFNNVATPQSITFRGHRVLAGKDKPILRHYALGEYVRFDHSQTGYPKTFMFASQFDIGADEAAEEFVPGAGRGHGRAAENTGMRSLNDVVQKNWFGFMMSRYDEGTADPLWWYRCDLFRSISHGIRSRAQNIQQRAASILTSPLGGTSAHKRDNLLDIPVGTFTPAEWKKQITRLSKKLNPICGYGAAILGAGGHQWTDEHGHTIFIQALRLIANLRVDEAAETSITEKRDWGGDHPFSGAVLCHACGDPLRHTHDLRPRAFVGCWHLVHGGCAVNDACPVCVPGRARAGPASPRPRAAAPEGGAAAGPASPRPRAAASEASPSSEEEAGGDARAMEEEQSDSSGFRMLSTSEESEPETPPPRPLVPHRRRLRDVSSSSDPDSSSSDGVRRVRRRYRPADSDSGAGTRLRRGMHRLTLRL